tara:strand:- start:23 stop:754 length:732 start_codon:yes stop_codon:yes gene_type:complete
MNNLKTALIIGATSSLATIFCRELAKQGWDLILCGRNRIELETCSSDLIIRHKINCKIEVADLKSEKLSFKNIIMRSAPFNNIFVFSGLMESNDTQDIEQKINDVIRVNFSSITKILEASITELKKHEDSKIMVISSVAGDRGRKSNYIYGSAKAAINEYCSGLRNRLSKFKINVLTVKLGFVDTPMTYGINSKLIANRLYVSKKIISALDHNKNITYIPFFWRYIMMIIISIPENIFKRLNL